MKVYFEFCDTDIKCFEFEVITVPKKGQLISFYNLKNYYDAPVYDDFKVKKVLFTYDLKTMRETVLITLKAKKK